MYISGIDWLDMSKYSSKFGLLLATHQKQLRYFFGASAVEWSLFIHDVSWDS